MLRMPEMLLTTKIMKKRVEIFRKHDLAEIDMKQKKKRNKTFKNKLFSSFGKKYKVFEH